MYDVIVIGAGFSGLQAAYSAQQASLSVAVVEARGRVGGKSWTVPLSNGRGVADLGAAWVNDSMQPRVWGYITRFGLKDTVVKQRLGHTAVMVKEDGTRIEFPQGTTPDLGPEETASLEKIRDHIQAESLKPDGFRPEDDGVSLDQYVRNLGATPAVVGMVNLWVRVMHGLESSEESAAWFIDYCRSNRGLLAIRADDHTGGNYLRLPSGTQSVANGIADLVGRHNIHLGEPVMSIHDANNHVFVRTRTGKALTAKKAILSIPSALYRDITFSPPLPGPVQEVTSNTRLGHYNKAIIFYARPWWRDLGYNGFVMSYRGPACVVRDTSVDEAGVYALTCFVNGREGERWGSMYPHERRRVVLDELAAAFNVNANANAKVDDDGGGEVYRPVEFFEQIWKHEEFSRGALAPVTALGHMAKFRDVYGKPVGNVHFVGTEYSNDWRGYLEGALASGEKGAQEVVDALGTPRSRL